MLIYLRGFFWKQTASPGGLVMFLGKMKEKRFPNQIVGNTPPKKFLNLCPKSNTNAHVEVPLKSVTLSHPTTI